MSMDSKPPNLVDFLTSLENDDAALAKALRIVSFRCDVATVTKILRVSLNHAYPVDAQGAEQ